jgi:hypothetical protein
MNPSLKFLSPQGKVCEKCIGKSRGNIFINIAYPSNIEGKVAEGVDSNHHHQHLNHLERKK